MEIKSSLLNSDEFKFVKASIENVSEIDNKSKERVRIVEYINDNSTANTDMFFYDMLEFVRFLHPNDDSIAYTTPDRLIYLNAPGKVGSEPKKWDFIYDHECLHQLWDTFNVGDKIKEMGIEYNHMVLNVASDCVINDYLKFYRKKPYPTDDLITPEYLRDTYGIDYNRNKDTQLSLYIKLLEKAKEMAKDDRLNQAGDGQGNGQNQQGGGQQGNSQQGQSNNSGNQQGDGQQGQNGQGQGNDDKDGQGQGSGQGQNKDGKDGQNQGQGGGQGQKSDKGDQKGQGQGQGQGQKGDKGNQQGQGQGGGQGQEQGQNKQPGGKGWGTGDGGDLGATKAEVEEIKRKAKETIEKYRQKISGDFGKFIAKCKSCVNGEKEGLAETAYKAPSSWNREMNSCINTFVKKKVFQKKRQYENTYSRVKRGSGFVRFGEPIQPGRKIKENKLTIDVAFYVDRSGSMSGSIDHCFEALYVICESLKKQFGKEKVVDEVLFKIYAFDTSLKEIKYGQKAQAGGGTMSFHELLKNIKDKTGEYLINVIITDAEFEVNVSEVENFVKEIDGMLLFITNTENVTVKDIAKKYNTKLFYILADPQFKIK